MTKIRATNTSRVRDRRGQSAGAGGTGGLGGLFGGGGGGSGGGLGMPIKAGGGLIGLIVVVVLVGMQMLGGGGTDSSGLVGAPPAEQVESGSGSGSDVACATEIEQVVCGAVNDVNDYWEVQYPQSFQGRFSGADTVFYSDGVNTGGCGYASAQAGPFYCPADQLVYFDLDFLQQLQRQFGITGDLAAQYIVAHEYGHHVQNITGISDRMREVQAGASGEAAKNAFSVALELQADCFAGTWVSSVAERGLLDDDVEIEEALGAAEAVGDDRIMEQAGMRVDQDLFTHGSAEQRSYWFRVGFDSGDPEQCRTFNGALAP